MSTPESRADQLISTALAVAMSIFFVAFGWYGLLNGGISLLNKFEHRIIYIGSDSIRGFGVLSFLFATSSLFITIKSRKWLRRLLVAIWAPFVVFLLIQWYL